MKKPRKPRKPYNPTKSYKKFVKQHNQQRSILYLSSKQQSTTYDNIQAQLDYMQALK